MILVVGSRCPDIPQSFGGAPIVATSSCIAIGCKAEVDGPTRFVLAYADEFTSAEEPAFVGQLEAPDGVVALETVYGDRIAEQRLASFAAEISVWTNDCSEPDEVTIVIACTGG
jgi:hypothetical protein